MAYEHDEVRDPHYPKMLFRPGDEIVWEGHSLDTLTVTSEEEEIAALDDGWRDHPDALDHDGDNRKGGSRPRKDVKPVEAQKEAA